MGGRWESQMGAAAALTVARKAQRQPAARGGLPDNARFEVRHLAPLAPLALRCARHRVLVIAEDVEVPL